MSLAQQDEIWLDRVNRKPLTKPFLIALVALFILCLPLTAVPVPLDGIHHPAAALSVLALCFALGFAVLEVIRQRVWRYTRLTVIAIAAALLLTLPYLYAHSDRANSLFNASAIWLSALLFIALQQFTFNHKQRQLLLYVLMATCWLAAISLFSASFFLEDYAATALVWMPALPGDIANPLLLMGLSLGCYLLVRAKHYKRRYQPIHFLLVLTPACFLPVIALQQQLLLAAFAVAALVMQQGYLFAFASRRHHLFWLASIVVGAGFSFWLTGGLAFQALSAPEIKALTIASTLFSQDFFFGLGYGQLDTGVLLYSVSQPGHDELARIPSALYQWLIEGGISVGIAYALTLLFVAKLILNAPFGTRWILIAMILPPVTGLLIYSVSPTQWFNGLILVVMLYWIDNLSVRYQRVSLPSWLNGKRTMVAFLVVATLFCLSSVYIANRYLRGSLVDSQSFTLYKQHPWWRKKLTHLSAEHAFIQDIKTNNIAGQQAFFARQLADAAKDPSITHYQNAVDTAVLIGDMQKAKQIWLEAKVLYPHHDFEPSTFNFQ